MAADGLNVETSRHLFKVGSAVQCCCHRNICAIGVAYVCVREDAIYQFIDHVYFHITELKA